MTETPDASNDLCSDW